MALSGIELRGSTVIAGLGGRPITKSSLLALFEEALADKLAPLSFLDMDWGLVNAELARIGASATSGPHAENILRDVGTVAAGPV
jgi:pyruvate ferredoxin oxidoreductase alpha subunit